MQAHLWQHDLRTAKLLEAIWALLGRQTMGPGTQWGLLAAEISSLEDRWADLQVQQAERANCKKKTFAGAGNACFLIAALGLAVCAFV